MSKRYNHFGEGSDPEDDCPYVWISEWLCEYVDGTMDPSMQAVFEEYMEANPELSAHVERLCRTRALLNGCDCRQEATERAKARLHHQTKQAEEEVPAPADLEAAAGPLAEKNLEEKDVSEQLTAPLSIGTVAAVASAMTLMLGVGMVAGATLFVDRNGGAVPPPVVSTERQEVQPAPDRSAMPPPRADRLRATVDLRGAAAPWVQATPPLPLKKMPTPGEDSARSSGALMQATGLNR